jgi:hypothetical protein
VDTTFPDWMAPQREYQRRSTPSERQLEQTRFELAFEPLMDEFAKGRFLTSVVRDYPIELDHGRFVNWIMRDPERKARYYEAQEIGAEMIASRIVDPETASQSTIPEDVNRDKLNFDKAKWWCGIVNKRRFAPAQQIELNQTISITAALAAAQGRLIEHENTRLIESE